jgi:FtsH-binding integral membrane protein
MTDAGTRRLVWIAAALAGLASLAFAFAIPAHVEDGWEYRGFFLVVAVAEMALAIVLAAMASAEGRPSARARRIGHATVAYGALLVAASVAVYFLTLVTGIQHAGHSAEVVAAGPAPLDLLTKALETALVGVLARLAILTSDEDAGDVAEG